MLTQLSPKEKIGYASLAALVLFALVVIGLKNSQSAYKEVGTFDASKQAPSKKTAPTPSSLTPTEIVVYVTGKVKNPGVYRLKANARTVDAVTIAGGPTTQADLEAINLAAPLADGEQVTVPSKDAPPPTGPSRGGQGQKLTKGSVSLNSATLDQLRQLPGVGPGTAQNIIDYRRAHGAFTSIDQLRQVGGIGAKKLQKLAPLLHL